MNASFELNGHAYRTDVQMLGWIRGMVRDAKSSGDGRLLALTLELGLDSGRIVSVGPVP